MTIPRRNPKIRLDAKQSIPNLHYGEMKEIARAKPRQLAAKFGLTQYTTDQGKRFWFKDNGAKVLFVAHLDSVQTPGVFQPVRFKQDTWIFSPTHDDRLGVYVGLCYLPKAKVKADILLTEDEEMGKSTALWFDPPKKYNWMFMFDRREDGCVLYKYSNEILRYKLGKHNLEIKQGLYSCICELEHLGCVGINFGTGYYDYHSEEAYASMNVLRRQLRKFINFYNEYKFVSMPHEIGYERFAQAVAYGHWEHKREEQESQLIGPKVETIKDAEVINYQDSGAYKAAKLEHIKEQKEQKEQKQTVTLAKVDKDGNIVGWVEERFVKKLYYPIDILNHDVSILNILRNTFKCNFIYDVAQLSPYKLVSSGYMTAIDADHLVIEMEKLGFKMPYNVAGFKRATQWELENAVGWKSREKVLRTSDANKPTKTNERLKSCSLAPATKEGEALSKRDIVMFPLPNTKNTKEMIEKSRGLIEKGYNVKFYFKCEQCNAKNIFDIMTHSEIPKVCSNCQAEAEKHTSSTTIKETEVEVFTKIQLRKDLNDDTIFELNRESKGKGVGKYHWVKPAQRIPEGEIGFVKSNSD